MNTNSRFIVATQIMVIMATDPQHAIKSGFLAGSVNTNPVVIRRILGLLRVAGLIHSAKGPDGGSLLLREPDQINLMDIYRAVDPGSLFHLHYQDPNQECPVGAHIQQSLSDIFNEAEEAFSSILKKYTLQNIAVDIADRSGIMQMISGGITIRELQNDYVYQNGSFKKSK